MAESPLVRSCILTISSTDLVKYDRSDLELQHVAVEYYGQAVSGLREAIQEESNSTIVFNMPLSDYNPLAVLLLCLHETQNFTASERILPHLNAAICLLQNRLYCQGLNSTLRGFLFELFCYFFALATYSLGSRLALYQACRIFNSPSITQYLQNGHVMGTSQHLFLTIFRISILVEDMTLGSEDVAAKARSELMALEEQLDATLTQSYHINEDMDIGCLNDAVTSEMYRLACLIYLKKVLCPPTPDEDPTIQSLVNAFVYQLGHLPSGSPSDTILSWPLVVTGLCATMSTHQRIIIAKLNQIFEVWQSDIFSRGAEFLREKWQRDRDARAIISSESHQASGMIWTQLPVILA
ncbi:Zn(II)2Cys6 transcription factor [Penicillium alfredii]|uniref:Zn(II)2Cys6 transcription factor n=1 Tax=Penicillium alfredii TaxID=1506179 RepID=A0A9W9JWT5_9EURO|nr:Zn(II)2Cys6 transcription factor [Penicillium alfredii]KAJ5084493.1 Zn(II)2Cys6 transcription factor [Penicillium alfredii]